jgi:hypothetical protein
MIAEYPFPIHSAVAGSAPGGFEFAVHVEDATGSGTFVQIVDI